jgi:hypothetical protein
MSGVCDVWRSSTDNESMSVAVIGAKDQEGNRGRGQR